MTSADSRASTASTAPTWRPALPAGRQERRLVALVEGEAGNDRPRPPDRGRLPPQPGLSLQAGLPGLPGLRAGPHRGRRASARPQLPPRARAQRRPALERAAGGRPPTSSSRCSTATCAIATGTAAWCAWTARPTARWWRWRRLDPGGRVPRPPTARWSAVSLTDRLRSGPLRRLQVLRARAAAALARHLHHPLARRARARPGPALRLSGLLDRARAARWPTRPASRRSSSSTAPSGGR